MCMDWPMAQNGLWIKLKSNKVRSIQFALGAIELNGKRPSSLFLFNSTEISLLAKNYEL